MKSSGIWKHLSAAFGLALVLYVAAFAGIQHARLRKGPWQVQFQSDAQGRPLVTVAEPRLGIRSVSFYFPTERIALTNLSQTVIFDTPKTNVPFGRVLFLDTTFLPGTVALDFFGHEVQLMPRVLTLDAREVPWRETAQFNLRPEDKLPAQSKQK